MEEAENIEEPVTVLPPLEKKRSKQLLLLGGGLCLLAVIVRLVQINCFSVEAFEKQAHQTEYISQNIIARPGDIVDRKGRLLATSISAQSLYLVPKKIKSPRQTVQTFKTLFDLDIDWVTLAIEKQQKSNHKYLWLKHRLNRKEVQQVDALGLSKDEYGFQKEYLRCYPRGSLASHLLGTRNLVNTGEGGIEEIYNQLIIGTDGNRFVLRENAENDSTIIQPPVHGKTIVLTIDAEIQLFVEQELQQVMSQWNPKGCCAIAMNPKTGEILASASLPQYDPNRPAMISPSAWRDQTISFLFEPGSMLDPLIAVWGLEKRIISKDQIPNSVAMQQRAEHLQNNERYNAATRFGFGKKVESNLPDEQFGNVLPLDQWGTSADQRLISVTPLQLITAYTALANNGKRASPRYVLQQVDAIDYIRNELSTTKEKKKSGIEFAQSAKRIISQENANWIIINPMIDLVNEGTGRKARLHDYAVFGYSGTSQKQLPSTEGNDKNNVVCSFICGAPADDPHLLILVVVDGSTGQNHPTGGTVAAPAAAKILHKSLEYLKVPTLRTRVQAAAEKSVGSQ